MRKTKKGFDFGDFEITKREILASISIIAVMILFGVLISSKISECQMDKNEIYNKAVKIDSQEMFQYGMDTNIGNAFVYGELKAIDTVTYTEIGGEYMYVKKVKEKYTMHTRQVAHTRTVNGKTETYYTTEEYWTWDKVNSSAIKCKRISFCGIEFPGNKIVLPTARYISTIRKSLHIRYKYYGVSDKYKGTIFANLRNKTIQNNTKFYNNRTIDETVDYLESDIGTAIFWIVWIILICVVVFVFYYLDNEWLD